LMPVCHLLYGWLPAWYMPSVWILTCPACHVSLSPRYPHALFFLGLLQSKEFCKELSKTNVIEFIHTQQFRCALRSRCVLYHMIKILCV
jgi:hypothetical protein